jgi:hypothetical protein
MADHVLPASCTETPTRPIAVDQLGAHQRTYHLRIKMQADDEIVPSFRRTQTPLLPYHLQSVRVE